MSNFTVIVTDDRYSSYREEEEVLGSVGATLRVLQLSSEDEAIRELSGADGILVNLFPLTGRIIRSLDRCKVISRYGVGYDNVDVRAATEKGICVARVPDYCFEDVSDQALALLLGCIRKVAFKDRKVRAGEWNLHKAQPTHRVRGKKLGLVGFGGVARCLNRKVSGFGLAEVLVCDPFVTAEDIRAAGAKAVDMKTLLAEADFISMHVPLGKDTQSLIGEIEIGMMKRSAILINTSRGPVVNESALTEALRSGRIAGAGLDVFEKEPLPPESPLRSIDTVILSDHAGWFSEESIVELKKKAAQNVADVLEGRMPAYPVNLLREEKA